MSIEDTYILVVGFEAAQLAKRVNQKIKEGFKPIPPHSVAIKDSESDLYEYSMSMVYSETDG